MAALSRGAKGGVVFPRDGRLRKQWLQRISRQGFVPSKHSVVYKKHFVEEDFLAYTSYGKFGGLNYSL